MLAAPVFGLQTLSGPLHAVASPIVGSGADRLDAAVACVRRDTLLIGLLIHLWRSLVRPGDFRA